MTLKYRVRKAHNADGSIKFYAEIQNELQIQTLDVFDNLDDAEKELKDYKDHYPDVLLNEFIYLDDIPLPPAPVIIPIINPEPLPAIEPVITIPEAAAPQ